MVRSMDATTIPEVGGETLDSLLEALRFIEVSRLDENSIQVSGSIPQEPAAPFRRALLRIEAELILEEAAALEAGDDPRDDEERRAQALFILIERIVAEAGHVTAADGGPTTDLGESAACRLQG